MTSTIIDKMKIQKEDHFTSYLGMLIALGSFFMLFMALLASYGILRVRSNIWMSHEFGIFPLLFAWVNTMIILLSSFVLFRGVRLIENGKKTIILNKLYATIMFGLVFLILQIILWKMLINEGFTITSHQAGSVFYLLSGLHGLHITGGLICLVWVMFRIKTNIYIQNSIRLVSMFWHFLTFIWIIIFILVILI